MSCCCCDGYDEKQSLKGKSPKGRSCTDCLCFLIFIIFLLGMALITAVTILDGGDDRLLKGYDSYGNICDKKNEKKNTTDLFNGQDTTGLKYVLYYNYSNPIKSKKICVKECPSIQINTSAELREFTIKNNFTFCFYDMKPGQYDSERCPVFPIFKTEPLANRCIPPIKDIVQHELNQYGVDKFINNDIVKISVAYLYQELPNVAYLSGASLLITIILVFLLRFIARLMVVLVLLLSSLGSIALTVLLWLKYAELKQANNTTTFHTIPIVGIELSAQTAFLIYSILATIFTTIFILIIIILRKRIGLVIRLFAEAQKALADMPFLFLMPVFTFVFLIAFLIYWTLTSFMIYSYGDYQSNNEYLNNYNLKSQIIIKSIWIYHFVALIWISEFIFGCQSMLIASSVAKWYFTRAKSTLKTPICTALNRLIVYHMGSVALGSFLITLIRVPRYILMLLQDKIKATNSSAAQYCAKACICCLWCLEKFMKFINYNAYTIIAIEGVAFCAAARKAFSIIVENSLRVATINSVGDFILFLAKVAVTALTLILSIVILKVPTDDIEQIKFKFLPLLMIAIISFLIAHCFFTIYEMVIDAIMVCFCEDCRANDGSEDRPYYMSNSLKEFVDESSTKITINN